jgi:hypothetical protein
LDKILTFSGFVVASAMCRQQNVLKILLGHNA